MIKNEVRKTLLKIMGKSFYKEYNAIKEIDNQKNLNEFQEEYLSRLLLHANKNVPYYNQIFKEIGIVNNDKVDLSKFNQIPILTKEIIRNNKGLISKDYTTRKWYYNSSGGSTGEPVRFIQDGVYEKWGNAVCYYYYKDILGIDEPSVKKVILWGSERDLLEGTMGTKLKLYNWLSNTVFLNSFKMTKKDMEQYVKSINDYKPEIIRGYASSLYELCKFVRSKKLKILSPRIVVSSAETLNDEMRQEIENTFKTRVYDYYGSREVNNIAGECNKGSKHILAFHNYVEVLNDSNQTVQEGEEGRVIVTNLHNYSMPFIRYEIGDMAVIGPRRCECGNIFPTLKKITGRITEHFVRRDGSIISGAALTLTFNLMDWVSSFQIIQEDYEKVKILVIPKSTINLPDKSRVEEKLKLLLGSACKIDWEFVDAINKSKSGKYFYIKSLIAR